jgi:hypothetical protein
MPDEFVHEYVWIGPDVRTSDGIELHGVVARDASGQFHVGTRWGKGGSTVGEPVHEEHWSWGVYPTKEEAIVHAGKDVRRTADDHDRLVKTESLLVRATSPKQESTARPKVRSRTPAIDR